MKALAALLFALTASTSMAADLVQFEDAGQSSLKVTKVDGEDGYVYRNFEQTTVNYSTQYQWVPGEDNSRVLVLKSTTVGQWSDASEGTIETTTVQAYLPGADQKYGEIWNFTASGGQFQNLTEELGAVSITGCCDSPTLVQLYRYSDGGFVNTVHEGTLMNVRGATNTGPWLHRYIGYAWEENAPEQAGLTYITTLSYFAANGNVQKVRLYGKMIEEYQYGFIENFAAKVESQSDYVSTYEGITYIDLSQNMDETDPALIFRGFSITGTVNIDYNGQPDTFEIKFAGDKIDRTNSTFSARLVPVYVD